MKSLLEINPNKLVVILFLFAIFILPITLIFIGVEFNAKIFGIFMGINLIIFFFFIYPKISKNKEFLAQMEEDKAVGKVVRQLPGFFKVKLAAIIILFLIFIISIYLYYIQGLHYLEFISPVLVFMFMMYYANFLKQYKKTINYGIKLENIEKSGFRTFAKNIRLNVMIYFIFLIIFAVLFLYLYL